MLIPYFPNPFSLNDYNSIVLDQNEDFDLPKLGFNSNYQFVDSATHGIYLLLKSFNLPPDSKVGLTPLLCNSVTTALLKAGFKPYYFDINNEFVLDFNEQFFLESGIKVLILPHLYGALHPDTEKIIKWCKDNSVFIISDTAQSFGLKYNGRPTIEIGDGGVYSFGFGKASTCAGGAVVYNLNKEVFYSRNSILKIINNKLSKIKLASRTYSLMKSKKNFFSKKIFEIITNVINSYSIDINKIQYNSLKKLIEKKEEIKTRRNNNYDVLKNNLNPDYFHIPDSFCNSLKFKFVFTINSDAIKSSAFVSLMKEKGIEIHNCSSTDSVHTQNLQLLNYNKLKNNLFELSTEAGIPEENFYEAVKIMNNHINYL